MSDLKFIESYKDLLNLINQHEGIIAGAQEEIDYLTKQLHTTEPHDISSVNMDGMPKGNLSLLSIDRCVEGIARCQHLIEIEKSQLEQLRQRQGEIKDKLDELEGLYFKVAVLRDVEGKSLTEIADYLGYSLDYIKHISAEIRRG